MATYKVIQDIEAEDKFVGPLTLKQFVFAMGGAFFTYLAVFFAKISPWLILLFLPFISASFFMAVPWSKTQPTEVWVLAKLRFRILPKRRTWDQSGLKELVTITAPRKEEKHLTKELSQAEVKGRLKILADTIDSRGWAIKNIGLGAQQPGDDRLIDLSSIPQPVEEINEKDFPDILDEQGTPETAKIDQIIKVKDQNQKQELQKKIDQARNGELPTNTPVVMPPKDEQIPIKSQELRSETREKKLISLSPKSANPSPPGSSQTTQSSSTMTTPVRADIIELSRNNDLNVATIARQANKKGDDDDEVVVSLR